MRTEANRTSYIKSVDKSSVKQSKDLVVSKYSTARPSRKISIDMQEFPRIS